MNITYTLNCEGHVGDMLYLTDRDYSADHGHSLAEVKIYGIGQKNLKCTDSLSHFSRKQMKMT